MGGIVNAFAIESRGDDDESEEGGNAEPRERRTREGVGNGMSGGILEWIVADKSRSAASGVVSGRRWGWYTRPASQAERHQ